MKVSNSEFGAATKEVYYRGRYCGLCQEPAVPALKALERSVNNSAPLRSALVAVMSRQPSSRPLGGFAGERDAVAWLTKYGGFGTHLWVDAGRGLLWSPVAWSLVMRIGRHKNEEPKCI